MSSMKFATQTLSVLAAAGLLMGAMGAAPAMAAGKKAAKPKDPEHLRAHRRGPEGHRQGALRYAEEEVSSTQRGTSIGPPASREAGGRSREP